MEEVGATTNMLTAAEMCIFRRLETAKIARLCVFYYVSFLMYPPYFAHSQMEPAAVMIGIIFAHCICISLQFIWGLLRPFRTIGEDLLELELNIEEQTEQNIEPHRVFRHD